MTPAETSILVFFRRYGARPTQMLVSSIRTIAKCLPPLFRNAMESLMRQGFVVKERPKLAYSLTRGWVRAIALDCSAAAGCANTSGQENRKIVVKRGRLANRTEKRFSNAGDAVISSIASCVRAF